MTEKKKKSYYLSASSKEEMEDWIRALEQASMIIPSAEDILRVDKYKIVDQSLLQMLQKK